MHPDISVIIPTRDRRVAVTRLLQALSSAHSTSPTFEVIVADDGSVDGTGEHITSIRWPLPVNVIRENGRGAAAARNRGARSASGDILLFLDDDIEPQPGLIEAHCAVHRGRIDVIGLGDLPPVITDTSLLGIMVRTWWEAAQSAVRYAGHRYTFQDLLSGHFSVCRATFEQLGGFDESLGCREDYEFGYRALEAGMSFRFLPNAIGFHHDTTDLAKILQRKFDEGRADSRLLRIHPAMASMLPLAWPRAHSRKERLLVQLAWRAPRIGDLVTASLRRLLGPLARINLRWRWRSLLEALLAYGYWRGVAATLGSLDELERMLSSVPPRRAPALTIDLADGLEDAEHLLDTERPAAVRLVFGAHPVGDVEDWPGSERLRGAHLRRMLATKLRSSYLRALAAAGQVPGALVQAAETLDAAGQRQHDGVAT